MHVSSLSSSRSDRYKRGLLRCFEHQSIFNALRSLSPPPQPTPNMKCIAAFVLFAMVAVALAKPLETESIEATRLEPVVPEAENAARDKRGLLLGAAYTAPVAYSAYTAPVAYTAPLSYPYSAYASYPYYASPYSAPYYVV